MISFRLSHPYKLIEVLLIIDALLVLIKVIVNIFAPVASLECSQEQFVVVLFEQLSNYFLFILAMMRFEPMSL